MRKALRGTSFEEGERALQFREATARAPRSVQTKATAAQGRAPGAVVQRHTPVQCADAGVVADPVAGVAPGPVSDAADGAPPPPAEPVASAGDSATDVGHDESATAGGKTNAAAESGTENGGVVIELMKQEFESTSAGPVKVTPELTGKLTLKDPKAKKPEGKDATKAKGTVGKDSIKSDWKKKVGDAPFTGAPVSVAGEVKWTAKGPKMSLGLQTESKTTQLSGLQLGPAELAVKLFEWEAGKKPHAVFAEIKAGVTTPPFILGGMEVTPTIETKIKVEPNWEKIIEHMLKAMTVESLTVAAAVAGPLILAALGTFAWAKAGNELNEFEAAAERLRGLSKGVANQVVGAPATSGIGTINEVIGLREGLGSIRGTVAQVEAALGMPSGAIAAKYAKDPGMRDLVYREAWKTAWPALRAAAMEKLKDTTFEDHKLLRRTVDAFSTGPWAQGF